MTDFEDRLFATIQRHRLILPGDTVIAAVSGGVDSLALLHGLIRLRGALNMQVIAATLDHGLRADESAADAAYVQQIGAAWGVDVIAGRADVIALEQQHRLNREDAARRARYSFLVQAARQTGAAQIATAHHQDDQAETVLMHLIRGSGINGLGGMPPALVLNEQFCLPGGEDFPLPERVLGKTVGQSGLTPYPLSISDGEGTAADAPPLSTSAAKGGEGRGVGLNQGAASSAPTLPWPRLIRPLLEISRAQIEAYAAAFGITPRHDSSNDDTAYLRNFVRHRLIPLLHERNPQIGAGLARLAETLRGDADLIRAITEKTLAQVLIAQQPGVLILDRAGWDQLSLAEQRHVVRAAAERVLPPHHEPVTFEHVERVINSFNLTPGRIGAGLWAGFVDTRLVIASAQADVDHALWDDRVPSLRQDSIPPAWIAAERVNWTFGAWRFSAGPVTPDDDLITLRANPLAVALLVPAGARLSLRTRQPGDRFRPYGMGGQTQKLSDTWINGHVPPRWRDRVPLLIVENEIAWWVALARGAAWARISERFAVPESSEHWSSTEISQIVVARWQKSPAKLL